MASMRIIYVISDAANNPEGEFPNLESSVMSHLFNGEYVTQDRSITPIHIPKEMQDRILEGFRKKEILSKEDLKRYRIDYIIYGSLEKRIAKDLCSKTLLKKVYEDKVLEIYQLL